MVSQGDCEGGIYPRRAHFAEVVCKFPLGNQLGFGGSDPDAKSQDDATSQFGQSQQADSDKFGTLWWATKHSDWLK